MGTAVYPEDGQEADALLNSADAAMYQAKRQGKNYFQF
ncbi:diguanylate cyclase domain-containing protein [Paenibacillus vulneris]|uniref:Diguanylate cyclase domain-containing protein n=1 Tax=Paenibacillus vulneris TaxID=1133364 RepID=A0ABW3UR39_9BACL